MRTSTFTPRALIWDMRGGYGSMKKTNALYSDGFDDNSDASDARNNALVWDQGSKPLKVIQEDQVAANEYQQALDTGKDVLKKAAALNPETTRYWSDYSNIYYNPKSFHQLNNWEYDPVRFPRGKPRGEESDGGRQFVDYETGATEFSEMNVGGEDAYLEYVFRPALEACDSLSGVTISTEADSAWGGFTVKVLEELREEYIPKCPVFTWALYDGKVGAKIDHTTSYKNIKQSRQQVLSRIKTTTALARDSTLFIPISKPQASILKNYDVGSNWHSTALLSLPFETISVLSSLRSEKRVSMQTVAEYLQCGSTRNIVSSTEAAIVGPMPSSLADLHRRKKLMFDYSGSVFHDATAPAPHYFSKLGTIRPPSNTVSTQLNSLSLDPASEHHMIWEELFKASQLQSDGTAAAHLTEINCPQPFSLQKSFPADALDLDASDSVYVSLGVTTAPRRQLREMNTFVSKFVKTADEGRDELKEETSEMAEQYEWGWEESEESDDE
ncbi:hypothetical protein D0Z00_000399 [Geotrichum galactomycetum]|uniref:Uncharacterized protein n=1 Tax=Geotrichum galactomycetum TaxID=27317 RepID=A0ACB6VA48_9ASCO|nr:hypothetical protein D0Z00_000399 [Geotrichum candidum]